MEKDLDIVENALIYAQQPRLNTELKDDFYHKIPVAFKLEGDCLGMEHLYFSIENVKEDTIIVDIT